MINFFSNKYLWFSGPLLVILLISIKNDTIRSILFSAYLLTFLIYTLHESTIIFQKSKLNRRKIYLQSNLDIRNKFIDSLIIIIPGLLLGLIIYFEPELLQELLSDGYLKIFIIFCTGILIIVLLQNPVNEIIIKNNKLLIMRKGRIIKEIMDLNKIILSNSSVIFKTRESNIELSGLKIKGTKYLIANRLKDLIQEIDEIQIENNGLQQRLILHASHPANQDKKL